MKRAGVFIALDHDGSLDIDYTARAKHLLPRILNDKGPPLANAFWKMDLEDVLAGATPSPIGRTVIRTSPRSAPRTNG
ncbi:MAG: hypothetical protein JSR99_13580 [Proteobacteria bacterium]|nr:hypothetical protein [Pseudomonadota bacterium]